MVFCIMFILRKKVFLKSWGIILKQFCSFFSIKWCTSDTIIEMKLFYRQRFFPPPPPRPVLSTWYLHCSTGGSVVCVGMATLHHHRLRGQATTLRVCGHILQLSDTELQQHICHLGEEAGTRSGHQDRTSEFDKSSLNQGLVPSSIKSR